MIEDVYKPEWGIYKDAAVIVCFLLSCLCNPAVRVK